MSEIIPQFTYSPEGVLTISADLKEGFYDLSEDDTFQELLTARRQSTLDELSTQNGVEVANGVEDSEYKVSVEVARHLDGSFDNQGDPEIEKFLASINILLPLHPGDDVDRVVGIETPGSKGATAVINSHFHRWMQAEGITEQVVKDALTAMTLPFRDSGVDELLEGFSYSSAGSSNPSSNVERGAGLGGFQILQQKNRLDITRQNNESWANAEVEWSMPDLTTLGNCACWGVDRTYGLRIQPKTARLYEMKPHNVDFARQSQSLMLGIGSLAYQAAQYDGREDIFDGIDWRHNR